MLRCVDADADHAHGSDLVDVPGDLSLHVVARGHQVRQTHQVAVLHVVLVLVVGNLTVVVDVVGVVVEVVRGVEFVLSVAERRTRDADPRTRSHVIDNSIDHNADIHWRNNVILLTWAI